MRWTLAITLIVTILGIARLPQAEAAGRRMRAARQTSDAYTPPVTGRVPGSTRVDPNTGRYPKFQGGFHSRELQNIGVPSGDVGLRGNGFSMYPW